MVESRGKLLVSTKTTMVGIKIFAVIYSIILLAMGFGALGLAFSDDLIFSMAWDFKISMGVIKACCIGAAIFFIALSIWYLISTFLGSKSFCEVYENAVVGTTTLYAKGGMQKFELNNNEIVNVTESGRTIIVYTSYEKYQVLANKNRAEAIRAIRERIAQYQQK